MKKFFITLSLFFFAFSNISYSIDNLLKKSKETDSKDKKTQIIAFDDSYFGILSGSALNLFLLSSDLTEYSKLGDISLGDLKVTALAISKAKEIVACIDKNGNVFIYSIKDLKAMASYMNNEREATNVFISPEGNLICTTNYKYDSFNLFSFDGQNLVKINEILTGKNSGPCNIKFGPQNKVIAVSCKIDNTIKIFCIEDNKVDLIKMIPFKGIQPPFYFNQDNTINVYSFAEQKYLSYSYEKNLSKENLIVQDTILENDLKPHLIIESKQKIWEKTSRPIIIGNTIPKQKIIFYLNGKQIGDANANEAGDFKFRIKERLIDGEYKLSAKTTFNSKTLTSNILTLRVVKNQQSKKRLNAKF